MELTMLELFTSLAFRPEEMFINEKGKVMVEIYDKK
jgi:hypothetical protein